MVGFIAGISIGTGFGLVIGGMMASTKKREQQKQAEATHKQVETTQKQKESKVKAICGSTGLGCCWCNPFSCSSRITVRTGSMGTVNPHFIPPASVKTK